MQLSILASLKLGLRRLSGTAGSTLLDSLVSYWPLNEQSGVRYDVVGTNHLTDNNTVGAVNRGPLGAVADFLAASGEEFTVTPTLDMGESGVTVAGWVNRDLDGAIFSFDSANGLRAGTAGGYIFYGIGDWLNPSQAIPTGAWTHFAIKTSAIATETIRLFINGVEVFQGVAAATPNADTALRIGGCAGIATWDGRMSRFGIWNIQVSDQNIASLFNSGNGKPYADLTASEKTGLVSYWNLDETSGVRSDSHGTNHLTDNNTVWSVNSGPKGIVARFVAAAGESLTKANFVFPDLFTVSLWAYVGASPAVGYDSYLSCMTSWPNEVQFAIYRNNVDGSLLISDGSTYQNPGIQMTADSGWVNWIVTYDSDKKLRAYRNNVLSVTSNALAGTPWRTPASLYIGSAVAGISALQGSMAQVAIWDRVLTDGELTSLLNLGNGKRYSDLTASEKIGLVSYWALDEQSGIRYDAHGSNDLTDNNTVLYTINSNGAIEGAAARGISSNSESLSISDAQLHFTDKFSISWWEYGVKDNNRFVVSKGGSNPCLIFPNGYFWYFGGTGSTYWRADDAFGARNQAEKGLTRWRHHVLVFDGTLTANTPNVQSSTDRLKIYIDGEWLTLQRADGSDEIPATFDANVADLHVVGSQYGYNADITMDELAVWDRPLTAAEVAELFAAGRGKFYLFS